MSVRLCSLWSEAQHVVSCAVHTPRVPNAVYEPRNGTMHPASMAGQLLYTALSADRQTGHPQGHRRRRVTRCG
jgi:hypothetical protein